MSLMNSCKSLHGSYLAVRIVRPHTDNFQALFEYYYRPFRKKRSKNALKTHLRDSFLLASFSTQSRRAGVSLLAALP